MSEVVVNRPTQQDASSCDPAAVPTGSSDALTAAPR